MHLLLNLTLNIEIFIYDTRKKKYNNKTFFNNNLFLATTVEILIYY